ncbi:MAG TPA: DNA mismatch repair endonuclease MutL, partial [Patescibacteria group bacterium]
MKIKALSQDLINKIAAGEVVERPASVVKELLENSLDAGSNQIAVEIIKGGQDLIKVSDNGQGMTREDAELAVQRYTTSKIAELDDLFNINSFGFRGEALASIASVSRFKLQTKIDQELVGAEIEIIDGETIINEIGWETGTTVTVQNLFFNVPARQKFLKTQSTEFNHILDLFSGYALLYPDISWKLIHNDKTILNLPKAKDWLTRIEAVLGADIARELLPVAFDGWEIRIKGFVAKPALSKSNSKSQYIFVNNRPVRDYLISMAVRDAYTTLIPRGEYPVFVLKIDIDPGLVDVNVHPRKSEVKFLDTRLIYRAVYNLINSVFYSGDQPILSEDDISKNPALQKPMLSQVS